MPPSAGAGAGVRGHPEAPGGMICVARGIHRSRISEVCEMTGWLALIVACMVSGALGFSAVRLGAATSRGPAVHRRRGPAPAAASAPAAAPLPRTTAGAGPTRARHSRGASQRTIPPGLRAPRAAPRPAQPVPRQRASVPAPSAAQPAPSAAQPSEQQLALWASQVAAGTRKMSLATDGCRVTWNRSCKHGHPSWLVYLDYLSPE
jgi:hypothetical protein